ncbi:MAG: translation initiation factor [Vicingaceae bacterium]
MSKKSNKNRVVYSTNPDFEPEEENEEQDTLPANQQTLEVHLDRKNRGGKTATVVKGFIGTYEDLNDLGKQLKSACGVGGSAKEGEVIIQGEKRNKVMELLTKKGYKVKRVGG